MTDKFAQQASPAGRTASATVKDGARAPNLYEAILKAKQMLDALPKPAIFASSRQFSDQHFQLFKDGDQEYVLGHPDQWARVAPEAHPSARPMPSWAAIQIIDLDNERGTQRVCQVNDAMRRCALRMLEEIGQ